jgi:hypothetical protein
MKKIVMAAAPVAMLRIVTADMHMLASSERKSARLDP